MKYLIRKCKYKLSRSPPIHAYIPELTMTLTKYYRNIVNLVNDIIKSYSCIKHLNKL